jgi:hypothetical protein
MPNAAKAIAIRREDGRFFCGLSKAGRLQTSWSLAGARLFGDWQERLILKVELLFLMRKQATSRVVVRLDDE